MTQWQRAATSNRRGCRFTSCCPYFKQLGERMFRLPPPGLLIPQGRVGFFRILFLGCCHQALSLFSFVRGAHGLGALLGARVRGCRVLGGPGRGIDPFFGRSHVGSFGGNRGIDPFSGCCTWEFRGETGGKPRSPRVFFLLLCFLFGSKSGTIFFAVLQPKTTDPFLDVSLRMVEDEAAWRILAFCLS